MVFPEANSFHLLVYEIIMCFQRWLKRYRLHIFIAKEKKMETDNDVAYLNEAKTQQGEEY